MRPLLVHVSAHRLSPRSHPAIWRQVVGLAERYRQVFLEVDDVGYVNDGLRESERADLVERRIAVHRVERKPLLRREHAAWLAAGLRRRYGRPEAFVGQLGACGWRALALAAACDAPVFTLFYGSDARVDMARPSLRPRFQALAEAPGARFGGVSGSIVADLVAWGIPAERTVVQHSGIDLAHWKPPERSFAAGPLRIAMAGRLVPFKGHAVALRALASHRERVPGSRLHVYGTGPLEPEIRRQAAELGISDAVVLHGLRAVDELAGEMARADVALQTSVTDPEGHAEGLPNTVLEAMALGLPVVASRHAGIPEAVVAEETGLLAEEGDAAAVAAALDRLAHDPRLRRRLGEAGRARVERDFDARAQALGFADRLDAMRAAYRRIPHATRQRQWRGALDRICGPQRLGRVARLRAARDAWINRRRGVLA